MLTFQYVWLNKSALEEEGRWSSGKNRKRIKKMSSFIVKC